MGSTRLLGKVLMDLGGSSVLSRVVHRLKGAELVDEVVVATSDLPADDAIVRVCECLQVGWFRGSETDVLDRYCRAAKEYRAESVVRITADCPLIAPEVVDETISLYRRARADYASNAFPRTYPRGLDTEVFTMGALEKNWREAHQPYEREHVTPYFYGHPELFRTVSLQGARDYSRYRWTLDTTADLALLRAIYERLDNRDDFSWREAIEVMEREPELAELNSHIVQKAVYAAG